MPTVEGLSTGYTRANIKKRKRPVYENTERPLQRLKHPIGIGETSGNTQHMVSNKDHEVKQENSSSTNKIDVGTKQKREHYSL